MKKTSVYLTQDEAADLRRLAVREGRSQAELIRDGIRRVIGESGSQAREFKSLGKGRGGGQPYLSWNSQQLYDKAFGDKQPGED
jgi:Arc/MetJ-type ribon-helix-helix transcriptional regulator